MAGKYEKVEKWETRSATAGQELNSHSWNPRARRK